MYDANRLIRKRLLRYGVAGQCVRHSVRWPRMCLYVFISLSLISESYFDDEDDTQLETMLQMIQQAGEDDEEEEDGGLIMQQQEEEEEEEEKEQPGIQCN